MYRGGQSFTFSGTGSDPEDGTLPPSAFTWRVDFHHDDHTHPFMPATSGITSGTFTIADRGETSANVFYRVILTVRDSSGLTHTSSVDVRPLTSVVRIESNLASAQLTLDGSPITAPFSFTGVEGIDAHPGRGDAADLQWNHLRLRVLVRRRPGDARDRDADRRYDLHRVVPARGHQHRVQR